MIAISVGMISDKIAFPHTGRCGGGHDPETGK